MGVFKIRYVAGQERWLDGHENEWKSSTEEGKDIGGIYRTDIPEIWVKGAV